MVLRNATAVVEFDADAACDYLLEEAGDDLLVCAEYTDEDYQLLYVSDELAAEYGSVDDLTDVADAIHGYIDLDFRERDLFHDLYPTVEDVQGLVTATDERTVARVLTPNDEGLYFAVPRSSPALELLRGVVDLAVGDGAV